MGFKSCELRSPWSSGEPGDSAPRWFCEAAQRPLHELAGPEESVEDVCARCPIPEELSRRPCLFMVPVKVLDDGRWREFFGCHWYHPILRLDSQSDTSLCAGCRDWFPRPPIKLNYRYRERTTRMIRYFEGRLTAPPEPPPARWLWEARPRVSWWRRLWHQLVGVALELRWTSWSKLR